MPAQTSRIKNNFIYDAIYGLIQLTPVEWEIIHSPFYQRLRWIKQLGFSCYVFPGAEHSRFGHSIGVMFNAHKILEAIGKAASEEELLDVANLNPHVMYHRSLRLAALMHDLGTFMFSHTTEASYIKYGETTRKKGGKGLQDNHEHLGSFIIKNTDYPGGITHILKKYGHDPQRISHLVKGMDKSMLANQILHSDVDCDRMDYLLRDAHYTGLHYGAYDREYLLHHFKAVDVGGQEILTIKEGALHCVEDFLMARYAWYSQVIRSSQGAKFDAIAEAICSFLLEKGWIYRYGQLLEMIQEGALEFYRFNDIYFMDTVHRHYLEGKFKKYPRIQDLAECLLFEKSPVVLQLPEFNKRLLDQDDPDVRKKLIKKAREKVLEMEDLLKRKGTPQDWILTDIPEHDVLFVKSFNRVVKGLDSENVLYSRDPVKIFRDNGQIKLLAEMDDSIIGRLQNTIHFIPNIFCSPSAYQLFIKEKLISA